MAGELADRFLLDNPEMAEPDDLEFQAELLSMEHAKREREQTERVKTRVDAIASNVQQKPDVNLGGEVTPGPASNRDAQALSNPEQTAQAMTDFVGYLGRLPKNLTAGARDGVMHGMALIAGEDGMKKADDWMREVAPASHEVLSGMSDELATPDPVTREITGFLVPFATYMKGLKAMGMSNVGGGLTADAAASFVNVDPHIERLSSLWASADLDQKDFWTFMADTTDTNRDVLDRIKNSIENVSIGVMGTALWEGVVGLRKAARGEFEWVRGPSAGTPQAQAGMVDFSKDAPQNSGATDARNGGMK